MIVRWLMAALHLLALGIGLGAVIERARMLRGPLDAVGLRRVFFADGLWGAAALLWISTGLLRAFAGLEKGSGFYLRSPTFWIKMSLLASILALEVWPAATLARWRVAVRRGTSPDTSRAPAFVRISVIQAFLVVLMVFAATAMARGFML